MFTQSSLRNRRLKEIWVRERTGHATETYCFQARVLGACLLRPVLSCVHITSNVPVTQGNIVVGSLR